MPNSKGKSSENSITHIKIDNVQQGSDVKETAPTAPAAPAAPADPADPADPASPADPAAPESESESEAEAPAEASEAAATPVSEVKGEGAKSSTSLFIAFLFFVVASPVILVVSQFLNTLKKVDIGSFFCYKVIFK